MKEKRLLGIYLLFLMMTIIVCVRLFVISADGTSAERVLSGQYTRRIDIASKKGHVFDRNGELLGEKRDGFSVFVNPEKLDDTEYSDGADTLSSFGEYSESYFFDRLYSKTPFVFFSKRAPGLSYTQSYTLYSSDGGGFLCHLLGYRNSDGRGESGIYRAYDGFLSQDASGRVFARYEASASGSIMDGGRYSVSDERYSEENGIVLTIDKNIQSAIEKLSDNTLDMGAVVVQDTVTGEILALVSRPGYLRGNISDYLSSDRGEFLNRAFMGYTPGSVFKTVVAAAALEKDISLYSLEYECEGYIDVFGKRIGCHNLEGHGKLDMKEAFSNSCNPYFINLALKTGLSEIISYAQAMGVGSYSDIGLLSVFSGNLPDGKKETPALTANTAVGQGEVLLSPVHVCSLVSSAVSGYYVKPSLILGVKLGESISESPEEERHSVLSDDTVVLLKEMLVSCVKDGTGYRADGEIECAGKTATAQSGQIKDGKEVIHTWFAGYFPADNPQYTVCVLCDGNGENKVHPSEIFRLAAEAVTELAEG